MLRKWCVENLSTINFQPLSLGSDLKIGKLPKILTPTSRRVKKKYKIGGENKTKLKKQKKDYQKSRKNVTIKRMKKGNSKFPIKFGKGNA